MTPQEEIEFLRNKVTELETKLVEDKTEQALIFSLSPMLEKIFRALMREPRLTSETLTNLLGEKTEPKTAVFRLRKHLLRYDVDIKSRRNAGYWIEPDDKKKLFDAMRMGGAEA